MRFIKFTLLFFAIAVVLTVLLVSIRYSLIPRIDTPISILVLGKGGEGHTGPNLTDTIMVAHINKDAKKTTILSLPRDIWVPEIRAKLNTAYHYGGFEMAGDSVYSITNIPVTNTIVIDFSLFKDVVDSIGGIKVDVENSFVDEKYPIAGLENDLCNGDKLYKCRYEILTFNQGHQIMDGETALKFVRSRNSNGDEGTDLARENRQQKVISAIKDKVLSKGFIFDYKKINALYNIFIAHIETDVDQKKMIAIARFFVESKLDTNFLSIPEDILVVSQNDKKYDRQYVFVPKSGSWKELQEWIQKEI